MTHVTKEELSILRKLTKDQIADIGGLLLEGSRAQLELVAKDTDTPVLKAMMAQVCLRILNSGSISDLNLLLDRLVGKVKEVHEHSGVDGGPIPYAMTLTAEQRQARREWLERQRAISEQYDL